LGSWYLLVGQLVKAVVNNLSNVDDSALLNLNICVQPKLESCIVNVAQIPEVVIAIHDDNHELRIQQFFIVGKLEVIPLPLSNFKDGVITRTHDILVLQFFRV